VFLRLNFLYLFSTVSGGEFLIFLSPLENGKVVLIHSMNAYWGRRGITSLIFNLTTRWRLVVNFTPWPLFPWGITPSTPCSGGWVGLRTGLDVFCEEKNLILCLASNSLSPLLFINKSVNIVYFDFQINDTD
jgi:hypothetical protein